MILESKAYKLNENIRSLLSSALCMVGKTLGTGRASESYSSS